MVEQIPVDRIVSSPFQARREFDAAALRELAESMRQVGMLQPVLVRPIAGQYQLLAGERRLRAAKLLGWSAVAAIVRPCTDGEALEVGLIENLQRSDITIVEAARSYYRLQSEFGYTHGVIAQRTGKSRPHVANAVRLLQLPEPVLELIHRGDLSEGHGRALLVLSTPSVQVEAAEWAARNAVTVRELDDRLRRLVEASGDRPPRARRSARPGAGQPDVHVQEVEARLRDHFGTHARIHFAAGIGRLELEFYGEEDLSRLLELMGLRENS